MPHAIRPKPVAEKVRFTGSGPRSVNSQHTAIVHAKNCILRRCQREFGIWGESLLESVFDERHVGFCGLASMDLPVLLRLLLARLNDRAPIQ